MEEEAGLTLIDAALPYSAKGILQAEKIGKPITKIVLTHAHDDHIGALDALKKYFLMFQSIFLSGTESC